MLKSTEVEQRAVFFRELATMVRAGLTMAESLEAAGQHLRFWRLAQAARQGAQQARLGKPFSTVMSHYPDVFTPVDTAMIRAGEESGRLDRLLDQIASYLETEYSLRQMISRETFYPKIIFVAILIFLLGVPTLVAMLSPGGSVSGALGVLAGRIAIWVLVALVLFVAYLMGRHVLISSERAAESWDTFKLQIPVFGEAIRKLALARFCRGLAALFAAGVSLPQSAEIASDLTANQALRRPMKAAVAQVQNGKAISEAFEHIPAMDNLTLRMLQTGEQTGNIDEMMHSVAEHYEEASVSTLRRAAQLTVPIATVIAGAIVFVIALHVYMSLANQ